MGKNKNKSKVPTTKVSLCTPTFNRRPFIKMMIDNIMAQTYPKHLMEWIIVDDGTDPIGDLVKDIPFVHYFYEKERMDLGKKRNYMHKKCTFDGPDDIIVYIDDDDFYPPERVSHSVEMLNKDKNALCAGSSELYLWFNELNKMYKFGPYGPNHSTAGTFAFKRKLLNDTSYEDDALLAEEKHFLKNYTVPFVQLNPLKTILVVAHSQNTFDKKNIIDTNSPMCNESNLLPNNFIKNKNTKDFYVDKLDDLLKEYADGDVSNKPKVVEEIKRRKKLQQVRQVMRTGPDGTKTPLSQNELVELFEKVNKENQELKAQKCATVSQTLHDGTIKTLNVNDMAQIIKQQQDEISRLNATIKTNNETQRNNNIILSNGVDIDKITELVKQLHAEI